MADSEVTTSEMAETELNPIAMTKPEPTTSGRAETGLPTSETETETDNDVKKDEQFTISKYVIDAYGDAKLLLQCGRLKLIFILCVIIGYLSYGFYFYFDKKQNQVTQTEFVQIDKMRVPYYYIYASQKVFDLVVLSIDLVDSAGNVTQRWEGTDIEKIAAPQFNYEYVSNSDTWTDCAILSTVHTGAHKELQDDGSKMLFIPPTDLELDIGSTLRLSLSMKSHPLDDYTSFGFSGSGPSGSHPPSDMTLSDDLQTKYFNSFLYGLFWFADDVELLHSAGNSESYTLNDFAEDTYSNQLQLYYTFLSTEYYAYMDLFNFIDEIENTESFYYSFTPVSSLINYILTQFDAVNISNTEYEVRLNFYPNPAGEGLMTQIIKKEKKSWTDVFSEVGGMFTVINAFFFHTFSWLLLGFACWKGLAPNDSLNDAEKRKIRTYLHELKLIDDECADVNLQDTQKTLLETIDAKCCKCC